MAERETYLDQIALVLHHAHLYEKTVENAARIEENQRLVLGDARDG